MRGMRRLSAMACGAWLLLSLLAGCTLGTDVSRPEWARVVLSGASTARLEVLTSQKFLVAGGSVQLMESQVDTVSLPFDKTYTLASPSRFYVAATNRTQQSVTFRFKVLMEDRQWMDEEETLAPGEKVDFVYRYDEPTPNG